MKVRAHQSGFVAVFEPATTNPFKLYVREIGASTVSVIEASKNPKQKCRADSAKIAITIGNIHDLRSQRRMWLGRESVRTSTAICFRERPLATRFIDSRFDVNRVVCDRCLIWARWVLKR